MQLTASVVLYNTKQSEFDALLKSVIDSSCVSKLYIIDNSLEKHPRIYCKWDKIEYIPHDNTGYGASHNIALHKAIEYGSDYHVILNPDIEFTSEVLPELIKFMNTNSDAVYVLPKVIYPNGELQYLCKLLPTPSDLIIRRFLPNNKWKIQKDTKYSLIESGYDKIINPPCLSGCFMFLRVNTLKEHNIFFDERYFMYLEDFDMMRRLHRIGKTLFYPGVTIIHNHAKESYKSKKMLFIHIQSAIKYFNKFGWFFDKERKKFNQQVLQEIDELNKMNN